VTPVKREPICGTAPLGVTHAGRKLHGASHGCRGQPGGPTVALPQGMWSQTFKSVTARRHRDQPELTFDVIVHFVLVLLLGLLIIWRI
jgi:hypothetical protein